MRNVPDYGISENRGTPQDAIEDAMIAGFPPGPPLGMERCGKDKRHRLNDGALEGNRRGCRLCKHYRPDGIALPENDAIRFSATLSSNLPLC